MKILRFLIVIITFCFGSALNNGLARKPPMGWSTWLALCDPDLPSTDPSDCHDFCSEQTVRQAADAMVDTGMLTLGYDTLMISDCW